MTFQSTANNLSPDDRNAVINVFLRDLDESSTALASRANGPNGAGGDADSADPASRPVVSDNGRVAFISQANNLSADDNDALTNVFVRDALAGTTELVSRAPGPAGAAANASSGGPTTSADGRYVAFDSPATNLVAGTLAGVSNVFRRDVLGDAPRATPLCKNLPLPPAPARQGRRRLHALGHPAAHQPAHQPGRHPAPQRGGGPPERRAGDAATSAATRSARPSWGPGSPAARRPPRWPRPRRPTRPRSSTRAAAARATRSPSAPPSC